MIRRANEKDVEAILAIYNDAILHTTAVYTYTPQTLEKRLEWFHAKQNEGYPVWVYEHDSQVAGFATYGAFRAWPAYKYTVEHSIYVDEMFQNRGIGSALLQAIIHDVNAKEYATLVAGIDAANANSIHLHEKMGFTPVGVIRKAGYKFGQWLDLAFYERLLDGPKNPTEE